MAREFHVDIDLNTHKVTELAPGTVGTDAVNKTQLDGHSHDAIIGLRWMFNSSLAMADPGSGNLRTNTPFGTPAMQIAISEVTAGGVNVSQTLAALTAMDIINIQEFDTPSNWIRYEVITTPVDYGAWWLVPVSLLETRGTDIAKSQDVLIQFTHNNVGEVATVEVHVQASPPGPDTADILWVDSDDITLGAGAGNASPALAPPRPAYVRDGVSGLYYKIGGAGAGSGSVIVDPTAPTSGLGDVLWVDVDDPNATAGTGGIFVQPGAPAPGTGDVIWVDIDDTSIEDGEGGGAPSGGDDQSLSRYVGDVGAGIDVVVLHALDTRDVTVQVMRNTAPYDTVICDVERTSVNSVTLRFAVAVSAGAFRCVVTGRSVQALSVRDFGAVGNGSTDDQVAIQTALDSLSPGDTLAFPSGYIFNHSDVLRVTVPGVTLNGGGTINATNELLSSIWVRDVDDVTITDLNITNTASTERHAEWQQVGLLLMNCDGCRVSWVHITESGSAGLQIEDASNFTVDHIICEDTWSDAVHMTGGSNNGYLSDMEIWRPGDDGVACVSYETSPANHDITVERVAVFDQVWGRAFSVVGGQNITYRDIRTERSACAAIYVACEPSYQTHGASNILFEDMDIIEANTRADAATEPVDHGAALIYNGREGYTITDVTLRDIRIIDTDSGASRQIAFIADVATCIIQRVSLETVTVTRGPGTTLYENIPDTGFRYTGVVVDGASAPNHLGWT